MTVSPALTLATDTPEVIAAPTLRWHITTRVAFRFFFLYLGLYVLTTQMLGGFMPIPGLENVPDPSSWIPVRQYIVWVGHQFFHLQLAPTVSGSGDKLYDWVQSFALLLFAATGTVVWSALDRRPNYARLYKWFRLFVRFSLGTSMLTYGFSKLFPLQMPTVFLSRLLEPYGDFSPMGVIWYSIGAAPWYEIFIGAAEVLGGVLLLIPTTAVLGALLSFGLTVGIFVINMTYDVPVKLLAFHLIVFSLFLLARDTPRLFNLFVLNRPLIPAPLAQYGPSARSNRWWTIAQGLFTVWVLGFSFYEDVQSWNTFGGGAPKSPLYGIWDVDSMSINGELRPPLTTDTARFSHAVFQSVTGTTFQREDQSFFRLRATFDTTKKTIALKNPADSTWKSTLTYQRPAPNRLLLDGPMNGQTVHVALTLHDLNKFMLIKRGFNWVQENPINR